MTPDDAKQAWQTSVEIAGGPPLEEVRAGANKFYRYVKWRNVVEYVACVIVVVVFTTYVFVLPHILQKIGSSLIIVAAIYAAWQLHKRASAEPPERAGEMPLYMFVRGQLVRQRDALRGLFWWYILPFIPGLVLMSIGNALDPKFAAEGPPAWARGLIFGGMTLILAGIWWINQLGARRLQKHIDDIDALLGDRQ